MIKNPLTYVRDFMGKAVKFNQVFQFTVILTALWFSWQNKQQALQIQSLTTTNAMLMAQSRSNSKTFNEIPLAVWKKEYFPERHEIIMQDYNDAFHNYMMEPLGLGRYDYIRNSDFDFFPPDVAQTFFDEDFAVFEKFIEQPIGLNGERPLYAEQFGNHWVDLLGDTNKDGYWRWAVEIDGHYYIYGMLKKPRPNKNIRVVNHNFKFIKPDSVKVAVKFKA